MPGMIQPPLLTVTALLSEALPIEPVPERTPPRATVMGLLGSAVDYQRAGDYIGAAAVGVTAGEDACLSRSSPG